MPTNTPNPRTPYTCLQPVRRGSRPPIGRLPHSRTTLPELAVPRAPRAPGGAPALPGPGPAAAALTAGPAAPPLRRPARAMAGGRDALPGDGRDSLRARAGPGRGALP